MAGLCWMAVSLLLLLSSVNRLAAVDQNQLAEIVTEILNRYTPSYEGARGTRRYPMFSLAVTIPYNKVSKRYDMSQVTDSGDVVRRRILNCEVYTSTRVVAATVLRWPNVLDQCPDGDVQWPELLPPCKKPIKTWADVQSTCPNAIREGKADHAEYRVLRHFNILVNSLSQNDLLLFYILASPCDKRCASENESHPLNILNSINRIKRWNNYAVVFSNVFQPRGGQPIPEAELRGALERLGNHRGPLGPIGLNNIFRCNRQNGMQCQSCSSGGQVAPYCISDNSPIQPQPGRSNPPSQSGQGGSGTRSNSVNPRPGVSRNVGRPG
uniref:uncharacterized protein LOC124051938 n=1 Tax=Scatophagus argus TaxID=75038 RepID=UPI001ED81CB3|nr:uncharacterized protein LOC124051938 [Scatophagus argus]